jgi:sulfonate transport system ATP-binding protein
MGTAALTTGGALPDLDTNFRGAAPPGAPVIARGLVKSFGAKTVLNGLDLHAPAGQFLAVVGRSGCGKSTLLRLLAGLDEADGGRISFGERATDDARRMARVMFQEARLAAVGERARQRRSGLGGQTRFGAGP